MEKRIEMAELLTDFVEDLLYEKGLAGDSRAMEIWLAMNSDWEIEPTDMGEVEAYTTQFLAENQDVIAAFLARESKAMGEA